MQTIDNLILECKDQAPNSHINSFKLPHKTLLNLAYLNTHINKINNKMILTWCI